MLLYLEGKRKTVRCHRETTTRILQACLLPVRTLRNLRCRLSAASQEEPSELGEESCLKPWGATGRWDGASWADLGSPHLLPVRTGWETWLGTVSWPPVSHTPAHASPYNCPRGNEAFVLTEPG